MTCKIKEFCRINQKYVKNNSCGNIFRTWKTPERLETYKISKFMRVVKEIQEFLKP